jgi:cell division protein FtsB
VNSSHLKIAFFFVVLILISYMVLIFIGDNGVQDLNAMKLELNTLKAENELLQQKNIEMHRKIKRLKEDPEFIENIARQELKMIGKNEVVFKFKEEDTVNTLIRNNKQERQSSDTNATDKVTIEETF